MPPPEFWDELQIYGEPGLVRIRIDGGSRDQGFDREAVAAAMAASAITI